MRHLIALLSGFGFISACATAPSPKPTPTHEAVETVLEEAVEGVVERTVEKAVEEAQAVAPENAQAHSATKGYAVFPVWRTVVLKLDEYRRPWRAYPALRQVDVDQKVEEAFYRMPPANFGAKGSVRVVKVTGQALGISSPGAPIEQAVLRAWQHGLALCPAQTALALLPRRMSPNDSSSMIILSRAVVMGAPRDALVITTVSERERGESVVPRGAIELDFLYRDWVFPEDNFVYCLSE